MKANVASHVVSGKAASFPTPFKTSTEYLKITFNRAFDLSIISDEKF